MLAEDGFYPKNMDKFQKLQDIINYRCFSSLGFDVRNYCIF